MTIQDWGALGELVGGVAIIVSLIYVGLQIRQGTQASRAATSQAFSAQYTEHMHKIIDADFRDIFWRGIGGLENLKGSEQAAFLAFLGGLVRTWESFYLQKQAGAFESRIFDAWLIQLLDLFAQRGTRDYWAMRRHQFTPDFVEFLEAEMATNQPKPMYPTISE